jgi:sulfonate transport system substrate-binding protein
MRLSAVVSFSSCAIKGLIDIIFDNPDNDVRYTRQCALVVRGAYEKEHADNVQKVVNVLVDAAKWESEPGNRDAVINEWAKTNEPVASLKADFDHLSLRDSASPLVDDFLLTRYRTVAEQAVSEKMIRRPVTIDGWFETKYLETALKAKGLEHYWTAYDANGKAPANSATASSDKAVNNGG